MLLSLQEVETPYQPDAHTIRQLQVSEYYVIFKYNTPLTPYSRSLLGMRRGMNICIHANRMLLISCRSKTHDPLFEHPITLSSKANSTAKAPARVRSEACTPEASDKNCSPLSSKCRNGDISDRQTDTHKCYHNVATSMISWFTISPTYISAPNLWQRRLG